MKTTFETAAAAGVTAFATDPVVKQLVTQLSIGVEAKLIQLGFSLMQPAEMHGTYMLNGYLGKQFVGFKVSHPSWPAPLYVICELRAQASGSVLRVLTRMWLNGRNLEEFQQIQESPAVSVDYANHQGEYKMQLATTQLRQVLGMPDPQSTLEGTPAEALLVSLLEPLLQHQSV